MKIYFNSDFTITKREYEEYFLGSEYHNKIEVYFPMISYPDYTYIYPVFNVKRPDDRKFGEFALTEYNVENDYIVWSADLPAKALEVEGALEITIIFKYSTDNKYAKVSTGKVLLNVKEAVIGEENDIIFTGSGDNLQGEIDAIRNEFGVRFDNVETRYINDLAELDNYKTPGIYRFNYNNANVFDLYITRTYQIRSSSNGYYRRSYNSNDGFGEWIFNEYNVNGSTQWNAEIQYSKGDIVRNNAVYVCIADNKGYDPEEDDENNPLYWIKFEPENYILKEEGKGLSSNDFTNEEKNKLARLDEKINDVVEIAEGKTNSYVLSYNETIETLKEKLKISTGHKVYDADGNDITAGVKNGDYDSYYIANNIFSSDSEIVYVVNGYLITMNDVDGNNQQGVYGSSYAILPLPFIAKKFKTGDIFYITEVDVPDRWYGGGITPAMFYRTESKKEDLSGYVKNEASDTEKDVVINKYSFHFNASESGIGASSVYMSPSTLSLSGSKDTLIQGQSFNELYRKVQNIYGLYIDFSIDDAISYYKSVPSGVATYSNINKVGGMSYKSNNLLVLDDVAETTTNGITYSVKDGVITLNGTATKDMSLYCFVKELLKTPINSLTYNNTVFITGKKSETIIDLFIALYDGTSYSTQPVGAITNNVNENTTYSKSFTYSGNNYLRGFSMYVRNGTIFTNYQIRPMLVSGTTAPTEFIQGFNGIRHSKVTDVLLNDEVVIPLNDFQQMDGYGVGINENCYNYLDFDRNVFVKKVGSYTFTGDERMGQTTSSSGLYRYWCSNLEKLIVKPSSNAEVGNILMAELYILTANQIGADNEGIAVNVNGTLTIFKKDIQTLDAMKSYLKGKTLYYELETPTETTISEIDTIIEVEEGDVITFENEYQNAVPSEIEYQVKAGN